MAGYYEQIGFYLDSILFGASESRATELCLRIRDIIASIREKLKGYYKMSIECETALADGYESRTSTAKP